MGDYPDVVNLILQARRINDGMPAFVLERVSELMQRYGVRTSEVGFYGLTYKENVDDVRESPSLQLYDCMKKHLADGARFYDPMVKATLVERQYFSLDTFLDGLKLVVIMVGHDEIKKNAHLIADRLVFDTRNCIFGDHVIKL